MIRALVLLLICLAGPSGAAPSCTADPAFGALDASRALTDLGPRGGTPARQALQDLGVSTLIRYYDHVDETLPCKTLMPEETAALLDAGFSLLAVFQSNGDDPLTFLTPGRGAADANRAIDLALMNGQPPGSAIYFGVDGVDEALRSANYEWTRSGGQAISPTRRQTLLGSMGRGSFAKHERFYEIYRTRFDEFFDGRPGQSTPQDMLAHIGAYFEDVRRTFHFLDHDERIRFRVGARTAAGLSVPICWTASWSICAGWPSRRDGRDTTAFWPRAGGACGKNM